MKIEFNSVVHRYSTVTGVVPSPAELIPGELALNLADGKLFTVGMNGLILDLTALNSKFNLANSQNGYLLTYDSSSGKYTPQPAPQSETTWTRTDNTTASNLTGIPSNTPGSTLVGENAIEILERILYPYVPVALSGFSVSGLSSVYEIGQSFAASGTATWTAGTPSANWVTASGYIAITNPSGVKSDIAGPFNPTSQSQVLTFPSFSAPTNPISSNSITLELRASQTVGGAVAPQTLSRNWRSRMYFGKSSSSNLLTPTFDIATGTGSGDLLNTSSSQGPSNQNAVVGAGAGYFYLFIHDSYTLSTAAPYFGLKYGGNALAQDVNGVVTVSVTNAYGVTANYKRYKSENIINDAITVIINPTS